MLELIKGNIRSFYVPFIKIEILSIAGKLMDTYVIAHNNNNKIKKFV